VQRKRPAKKNEPEVLGLLGVGFDGADGHKRVTKGENFVLLGGSEETHERMQDVAIHFEESLHQRGKRLKEASVEEVIDLLRKAADRD
jgi:hypothetical protein